MAIIVGDIHGDIEKARAFLAYKPETEHVALGDYLDSYVEPFDQQLGCLQLLMDSNAVLLWGNHDVHYLRESIFQFPGYQQQYAAIYQELLEQNIFRYKAAYVADGWLCTHAGVHSWFTAKQVDVEVLAEMFNSSWESYLNNRKEGYRYKAIFQFDFMAGGVLAPTNIKQVCGHDELSPAQFVNQSCVSIACNENGVVYLFDTESTELITLPLS